MKGLIVMYNKDKGYGFVKGEDNQEYHFKDRAIAFGEMPEKGRHCEFTPSVSTQTTSNKKSKKPQIEKIGKEEIEQIKKEGKEIIHITGKKIYPNKLQLFFIYSNYIRNFNSWENKFNRNVNIFLFI